MNVLNIRNQIEGTERGRKKLAAERNVVSYLCTCPGSSSPTCGDSASGECGGREKWKALVPCAGADPPMTALLILDSCVLVREKLAVLVLPSLVAGKHRLLAERIRGDSTPRPLHCTLHVLQVHDTIIPAPYSRLCK